MSLYSPTYAIPWLFLAAVLFLIFLKERHDLRGTSQRLACLVLILFFGLRGHLNTDFIGYYPFYNNLPDIAHLTSEDITTEVGFVIYSSIIKTVFPNYYVWVFINTLIDFIVICWCFRRYSFSVALSLLLFLAFLGIAIETNLYRNIKGLECFLLSLPYLQKRRLVPYLLINLLGCMFHISSLVYLLFYFFAMARIPPVVVWTGLIASNLIFFLHINLMGEFSDILSFADRIYNGGFEAKADAWSANPISGSPHVFSIGWFEKTGFFIFLFSNYRRLTTQKQINIIFLNAFFLFYILYLTLSPASSEIANRLSTLFVFSYWIILPNVFEIIHIRNNRRIFLVGLLLLCSLEIYKETHIVAMKYENILLNGSTTDYEEKRTISIKTVEYLR